MYCPQCGQQQVSDATRFCSKCGFLLEGVTAILLSGGLLPARYIQPGGHRLSQRSKGIRQGAMLMLSTLLLVPLVSIISVNFTNNPEIFIPLTAIFCFVGGLLRILYAVLMEEDTIPQIENNQMETYSPPTAPQIDYSARQQRLTAAPANPTTTWKPRPNTAEIYQPPSITENTTRLLDKEDLKDS